MIFLTSYLSTIMIIYIAIIHLIQFSSSVLCLPGDKPSRSGCSSSSLCSWLHSPAPASVSWVGESALFVSSQAFVFLTPLKCEAGRNLSNYKLSWWLCSHRDDRPWMKANKTGLEQLWFPNPILTFCQVCCFTYQKSYECGSKMYMSKEVFEEINWI